MANDFKEVMANRSDSELLEIVTKMKDDYQPEAVIAAETELKNRNLSPEQLDSATVEIKEKEILLTEKEDLPLSSGQKALFFLFFWGVIPWGMAGTFKANGYQRKYREAWKSMKYGLITFIGFNGLLLLLLHLIF